MQGRRQVGKGCLAGSLGDYHEEVQGRRPGGVSQLPATGGERGRHGERKIREISSRTTDCHHGQACLVNSPGWTQVRRARVGTGSGLQQQDDRLARVDAGA